MTREDARQKIAELVTKFESLSPAEIKSFHEAKTKQGFIEPLFRALGWNFDDTDEVTPEEKASNGRVDYAFKLHGVSQFYLEAKALKADLTNENYVKQAVTYAYNKGVTWAILTDFHELRLFNAQTGKGWLSLNCADYVSGFEKLWLLSRESLAAGLLDKEASQWGALPTPLPIEARLFKQLRQWREELFNQIHLYNPKVSFRQVDEVIQRLFNRLIFIRTSEDRGIEGKHLRSMVNQWKSSGRKGELEEELRKIFHEFDGYYDSDLFAHHLVDDVSLLSTTLESILEGLYEIPGGMASYDFSILDADVLGAVYEQYLGYVAQVVKQRAKEAQAKLDLGIQTESIALTEKKERRKEHGIYYTPKFVTDYIVRETVGRFLKERGYNEIRNIKILDPACGSGSFLIRAYDELLDYHARQRGKPVAELDQWERLPILTSNIFGVDLDMQAVEIARLNLLLRSLAKRDRLPFLDGNIRQGNSLISGTEEELKKYFGHSWRDKKPFNWEHEFKDIMAQGGFDVVIGNPPYIRSRNLNDCEEEFFRTIYGVAYERFDIYTIFIERGIRLLNAGGRLGFIVPNKFLAARYATKLREYLLQSCVIEAVVDVSNIGVFKEAAVYPCILIVRKEQNAEKRDKNTVMVSRAYDATALDDVISYSRVPQAKLAIDEHNVFQITNTDSIRSLLARITEGSDSLGKLARINEGIHTGNVRNKLIFSAPHGTNPKKVLSGRHVSRYSFQWEGTYVDYDHLLIDRAKGEYGSLRDEAIFDCPVKIVIRDIGLRPTATLDRSQFYLLNTLYSLRTSVPSVDIRFLLGLLNSALFTFLFRNVYENAHIGGDFLRFKPFYLEQLPIRCIDFGNPTEKKMHDDLVALVERMLELNACLAPIRDTYSNERDELLREIERTDKEIDSLVYDLYGLTEEERKIVKGEVSK
ncbi:MAG: N-6 DNA methylase [Chloroflexi bacterium]|nr:N-6 DNA methylase [Chloroflexota bacterium]